MTPGDMLHAGDWKGLAEFVKQRLGCNVSPQKLEGICERHRKHWPNADVSFPVGIELGDTLTWLKIRLWEMLPRTQRPPKSVSLKTELHVFFIFLDETAEMLDRLKFDEEIEEQVARSKISRTLDMISPVNRTAGRVVKAIQKRKSREEYQALREQRRRDGE